MPKGLYCNEENSIHTQDEVTQMARSFFFHYFIVSLFLKNVLHVKVA